jgi:hypothetical protein
MKLANALASAGALELKAFVRTFAGAGHSFIAF